MYNTVAIISLLKYIATTIVHKDILHIASYLSIDNEVEVDGSLYVQHNDAINLHIN